MKKIFSLLIAVVMIAMFITGCNQTTATCEILSENISNRLDKLAMAVTKLDTISNEYIAQIKQTLPELPYDKRNRYETQLGLSARDANILTSNQVVNDFFEECLKLKNEPKFVGNWVQTDIMRKQCFKMFGMSLV